MTLPPPTVIRRGVFALFFGAYLLLSLFTMLAFMKGAQFGGNATVAEELATPRPPIAYRVLVPAISDALYKIIPEETKPFLTAQLVQWRDSNFARRIFPWPNNQPWAWPMLMEKNIVRALVNMCVCYISLLAFLYALYRLAAALMPESELYALTAPLLALIVLPAFAARYGYTYDFAELFFSCACLYLLLKERWVAYLGCFLLAMFNKENAGFTIIFFMLWFYPRLSAKRYLSLATVQWLIFSVVKIGLALYFIDRPNRYVGGAYVLRLEDQIVYTLGYDYHSVLCLMMTFVLLTFRWQEKPAFLRTGLVIFASIVPVYWLTCNPGEYRDFYWALPPMLLLATHTLIQLSGFDRWALFRKTKVE